MTFPGLLTITAERHALIDLDVVADDRRLADDDAGAVVDEEIFADLRAGVPWENVSPDPAPESPEIPL